MLCPLQCEDDINKYLEERLPSRDHHIEQVKTKELDVLVIGGGATGAGCAVDAASRGKLADLVNFFLFVNFLNRQVCV